jgi:uncharacterized protein (TIGR02453 family)
MSRVLAGKKTGRVTAAESLAFTAESLNFLRGLARHNDREWFEPRRHIYESALRQPMLALIARVNEQMASFAPAHVKAPEKTVLRIYRDTRFSNNKLPYKQHYAAWWGRAGMAKTSGAGFYFHVCGKMVVIAAGLYMPDAAQLLAVRRHLLEHHAELRASLKTVLGSRKVKEKMRLTDRQALTRAPKGFPSDHPALDLILNRNWGVEVELPAETALDANFARMLAGYFRLAAPVVEFLNRPLSSAETSRPMFALSAF